MSKIYPAQPIAAVGAVVFKGDSVLLVRRGQPPNQGRWAIPGGCLHLGEDFRTAAEREIREETGIRIRARHPIYIFDVIERDEQGRVRYHYVITDLLADYVSGQPTAGDDAVEARWVTPDEFDTLPVSEETVKLLRGRPREDDFPPGWRRQESVRRG
uniref:ADP-ribose pyrophosphatase YjhB, NUDIX family n=1 Tax=Candidatus Kentrum sp. DK TaxID=2126562 RepID=A0A450TBR2_9GAMM|nr:MAG: ADP-ribose pyrophosphatase YjhB, NUDIX family [Candidatus Kentron sp. DK]VFJ64251.1 MAG: ADP-ribose pyrophosphatase YjhB, NUDIX family [Candidatus Kentron sp. DK]